MAKKSVIHRDKVRARMIAAVRSARDALRNFIKGPKASFEEKLEASMKLNKKPRNQSPSRLRRRCNCCGRPRGVYRKFGLCRICLRIAAMRGDVPGLVKSSW